MDRSLAEPWTTGQRVLAGTLLGCAFLLLLLFALNIPFSHPSSSILYKFGWDKTLLRGGKIAGITVILLLAMQPVLIARFSLLGRIFGTSSHFTLHRVNGFILCCLIPLHPVLVRAAENFAPIPFVKKYWPEYLGIVLICLLFLLGAGALWRKKIPLAYPLWRTVHALSGFLLLIAALVHAHFVSTSFQAGLPRIFLFALAAATTLLFFRLRKRILT